MYSLQQLNNDMLNIEIQIFPRVHPTRLLHLVKLPLGVVVAIKTCYQLIQYA